MSSKALVLKAETRETVGKKVSALRRSGKIPAVVYERGSSSDLIVIDALPLAKIWAEAGKHHIVQLEYAGKKRITLIKDIDRDPVKGFLTHVSFHAVNQKEKVEAEVPLRIVGNAPASQMGLIVRLNHDHIVVKGLPTEIPDAIEVDVSEVKTADDDVRASSLVLPTGIESDIDADEVIVSVIVPRAEVEKPADEEVSVADVPSDNGGAKEE